MAGKPRYKISTVIEALKQSNGMVALAARRLGCNRTTLYKYRDRYPEIQEVIDDCDYEMDDLAESALRKAILNGEGWAICFRLKTKGKYRGYNEKQEHDVNVNVREVALPVKAEKDEWIQLYAYNSGEMPRE